MVILSLARCGVPGDGHGSSRASFISARSVVPLEQGRSSRDKMEWDRVEWHGVGWDGMGWGCPFSETECLISVIPCLISGDASLYLWVVEKNAKVGGRIF